MPRPRPGKARGSRNGAAKLTEDDIPLIRSLWPAFSLSRIAHLCDVDIKTVHAIIQRKYWRHVP